MPLTRRDFFKQTGGTSAWLAMLLALKARAQESGESAEGQTDSVEYWQQFFEPPRHGVSRGADSPTAGSHVQFMHVGSAGLRYVEDIAQTPEQLSSLSGDVVLDISPGQFRSGNAVSGNASEMEFLHSAQLRFDVHQSQSFLGIVPTLAWVSLAAIFPNKAGKLPGIQKLDFTPIDGASGANKILLPGGSGSVALHVSVQKKPSAFVTVLKELVTVGEGAMPVLGLPAISVPALRGFSSILARLEERTTFLMSTSPPAEIAVTQESWEGRSAKAIPFPPGDYVMFPSAHRALLQPEFHKLTVESGYLVNREADMSLPLAERAEQAARGLTYVTMHVNVSPVGVARSETGGGESGGAGGGPSQGGKPKPKPTGH